MRLLSKSLGFTIHFVMAYRLLRWYDFNFSCRKSFSKTNNEQCKQIQFTVGRKIRVWALTQRRVLYNTRGRPAENVFGARGEGPYASLALAATANSMPSLLRCVAVPSLCICTKVGKLKCLPDTENLFTWPFLVPPAQLHQRLWPNTTRNDSGELAGVCMVYI